VSCQQVSDWLIIRNGNGLSEIKIILDIELLCPGRFGFGIGVFQVGGDDLVI